MNCQDVRRLLMTYLDSELDSRSATEMNAHLDECAACRARFEAEDRLERGMGAVLREDSMPAEEWESLWSSLRRPATPWWRWAAAAAALILALTVVLQIEPRADGLLHEMIRAHREVAMGRAELDLRAVAPDAIMEFLEQRSLSALSDGVPGTVEGHPIVFVGAREERLLGQPGVSVSMRCCGKPMSVFIMRRDRVDALPGEWQKALGSGSVSEDGLRARSLLGDELLVTQVWPVGHEPASLGALASL